MVHDHRRPTLDERLSILAQLSLDDDRVELFLFVVPPDSQFGFRRLSECEEGFDFKGRAGGDVVAVEGLGVGCGEGEGGVGDPEEGVGVGDLYQERVEIRS